MLIQCRLAMVSYCRNVCVVCYAQMYMEEPCFHVLRTKYKLSYSPHSDKRCLHDVIGFSVTVVSSAKLTFVAAATHSHIA